jgi:NAD(P)H-dependent FMN reductase
MFGAVWSQAELRKVLAAAGARVVDRQLPVSGAEEAFDDAGALKAALSRGVDERAERVRRGAHNRVAVGQQQQVEVEVEVKQSTICPP